MTMKKLQEKVKKFSNENNLRCPIEYRVLDLVSEIGEFSKEILKSSNYGKEKVKFKQEMKLELGDILFVLIIIANHFNIDLEEALDKVIDKYDKRLRKGSIGSENE